MASTTPSVLNLQAVTGQAAVIRRSVGTRGKMLQPTVQQTEQGIEGLDVTESTFEEWMVVEQQFKDRVQRRWL